MTLTRPKDFPRHKAAFFLLAFAVVMVYSNTFDASWHLDDYENILYNPGLHLTDLTPASLKKALYAAPGGNASLYRPVVMLSFALNRYWGGDRVAGFHAVNIGIHVASALFVYLSVLSLFRTPAVRGNARNGHGRMKKGYHTALLAALIWAVHPMQTQAVTYIVQRMASAGAMFFAAALYAYLRARMSASMIQRSLWSAGCLVLFCLALGAKENAVMLPLVILTVEWIFFKSLSFDKTGGKKLLFTVLAALVLMLLALFLIKGGASSSGFLGGYDLRSYTLSQRLMTEARILVFHLYQFFYPVEANFSVVHDVAVSFSLFSPWTTLPAIVLILFLVAVACRYHTQSPFFCFAVFFFFLNHVVESTVLPLELLFEHRNYLPGMFLFVPLASIWVDFLDRHEKTGEKRLLFLTAALATPMIVFVLGIGTYTRNFSWKTEKTLWTDAAAKAPGQARPFQELAEKYYLKTGQLDTAAALFQKAVALNSDKGGYSRMVSYDNLRQIRMRQGRFEQAAAFGEKAVQAFPKSDNTRYNHALALISANRPEAALTKLDGLLEKQPDHAGLRNTMARVLLELGRTDQALEMAGESMKLDPLNPSTLFYFGLCHLASNHFQKADLYLKKAMEQAPGGRRLFLFFALIDNAARAGWETRQVFYLERLLAEFPIHRILNALQAQEQSFPPLVRLSRETLYALVTGEMRRRAQILAMPRTGGAKT